MTTLNGLKLNLREKPDGRVKLIRYLVSASWLLAIITFFITCFSMPPIKTSINQFLNLNLPVNRNYLFMAIALFSLAATFLVSITGVILNITRSRRRDDRFYYSLVVIGILSGVSILGWFLMI